MQELLSVSLDFASHKIEFRVAAAHEEGFLRKQEESIFEVHFSELPLYRGGLVVRLIDVWNTHLQT